MILRALRFPVGTPQEATAWWLSFTVSCQRTVIFDSVGHKGAEAHAFGGPGTMGTNVTLPANLHVCEDIKIEMYRHVSKKKESRRQLIW